MDLANIAHSRFYAQEAEDMLNAKFYGDFIDTKDLCLKISAELTDRNISQALFGARIIYRSQGTLSDLLSKPKPWHILRSGRITYIRMFNWMSQPLEVRMAILYGEPLGEVNVAASTSSQKKQNERKSSLDRGEDTVKKPRLVFTTIQKRTLEKIFEETQRPNKELQKTIAEHFQLDVSTVSIYFLNNRRRSNVAKTAAGQNSLEWIP